MTTPLDPTAALGRIHALLDGTEWDADTLDAIADVVRAAGLAVRGPEESET